MVKKVITNLCSSKASGLDYIPVVVLRNCESKLSNILAEFFNMCLNEFCFRNCWKYHCWSKLVSLVIHVFKNVGERSITKIYCPVSILSVVSKAFQKLVNKLLVDLPENGDLFSVLQYDFRSPRSTVDLLTVVSDGLNISVGLLQL